MSISPEDKQQLEHIAVDSILEGSRQKNPALIQAGAELFASLKPDGNQILGEQVAVVMRKIVEQAHSEIQPCEAAALEERKAKAEQLIKNRLNSSLASTLCAEASKLQSMLETGVVPPGILSRLGLSEGRQAFTAEEQAVMRGRIEELKSKAAELLAEMDEPALQTGHGFLAC